MNYMNYTNPHIWFDTAHVYHHGDDMHPENPERVKEIVLRLQSAFYGKLNWHVMDTTGSIILDNGENSKLFNSQGPPTAVYNNGGTPDVKWKRVIDGDMYYSEYTDAICKRGLSMISDAIEHVVYRGVQCAFIAIRPPGHHVGGTSGPQGFCHQNNVWKAVEELGRRRIRNIGILDWDVHHGDGTEDLVRQNKVEYPGVKFVSIHAYGPTVYPGTGKTSEDDTVMNIGLKKGTTSTEYLKAYREKAVPFLGKPDVLIVSAGYDAHYRDPMLLMKLRSNTYGIMSTVLKDIGCPVLFMLEGGYSPEALAESVEETLKPWIKLTS
jgi:acetoin utilization deacetylase AcuC-like enzyme